MARQERTRKLMLPHHKDMAEEIAELAEYRMKSILRYIAAKYMRLNPNSTSEVGLAISKMYDMLGGSYNPSE